MRGSERQMTTLLVQKNAKAETPRAFGAALGAPAKSEPAEQAPARPDLVTSRAARYVFAGVRLALGWIFLWAFLDKVFGLGHETPAKASWLNGGSPTTGFLKFGAQGPFTDFYHSIAGAGWTNWLF